MLYTLHNSPFVVHPPPEQNTGLFCPEVTDMVLQSAGCENVQVVLFI